MGAVAAVFITSLQKENNKNRKPLVVTLTKDTLISRDDFSQVKLRDESLKGR
jgi:hypothetical protein